MRNTPNSEGGLLILVSVFLNVHAVFLNRYRVIIRYTTMLAAAKKQHKFDKDLSGERIVGKIFEEDLQQ